MNPYSPIAGTRAPLLPAPIAMPIAGTRAPLLPPRRKAAPSKPPKPPTSLLGNLPTLLTDAQARDQVMALLAPIYAQQNAAINAAYDQRANALRAAYDAAARYAQGVAPAIQGIYQGASRDTAAFAKGFSDAITQGSQGAADAATQQIASVGGPQTVTSGLANGGGDALYAMGGSIPASQLSREGAAFGSAASFLPTTASRYGAQAIGDSEAERIQALREAQADQPATVLDMIGKLTDQSYSRRQDALQLALNERDYRDKQKSAKSDRVQQQWEAAALKQAYGYKLTPFEKRLLKTYGSTPDAVEAAGKARVGAAEDQRRAAAAAADDRRSAQLQSARDRATAARQAAHDARTAMLAAKKAAATSKLEKDKQTYRMALEKYKAAQRKALQRQRDAAAMARQKAKPKTKGKSKTTVGNPGDSYFGE